MGFAFLILSVFLRSGWLICAEEVWTTVWLPDWVVLRFEGTVVVSSSARNAPLAGKLGSECCRGSKGAGIELVAVADETVAEDCEAPIRSVAEDMVFGDVVSDDSPQFARIAWSPTVGPLPRYGSAKTL